jgi:hypothetical protein
MTNPFTAEGFVRHNRQLFTKTSIPQRASSSSTLLGNHFAPSTIIICSWMSAEARHIKGYLSSYATLYPRSHILLVLCPKSPIILFSRKAQQLQLLPGVRFLVADNRKEFLVHIFTGGGAISLCNLAIAYRKCISFLIESFAVIAS